MTSAVQHAGSLADFIRNRRWFRSKAREIRSAEVEDVIPMPSESARFLLVRVNYAEGDCDHYVVTDKSGAGAGEPVEALNNAQFRNELLAAFASNSVFKGSSGALIFARTAAFRAPEMGQQLESAVSRAEQSNTSIIFGDQYILKLFRKIEAGTNPDVEIGAFLTEHGFAHTPAVLGTVEYSARTNGEYSAGILQQFVPNKGDAWKYTLDSLNEYFGSEERDAGDYLRAAALLGQRTAEMHKVLASGYGNPDFEPEPFTKEAGEQLFNDMVSQADIAFETLRRKQATLSGQAAELGTRLLHLETRVTERFSVLRDQKIDAARIRFHGDYHLGQVLWTGSDFMIIDFEGEPARPLSERRAKGIAMRDVAGMLRSFQYAAYAALFEQRSGAKDLEMWAETWNDLVSDEYLNAYLRTAEGSVFLPQDQQQQRVLLDAFILHKALYEVAYELNNRPDWVHIPVRGILSLVD
ncbi:MAG TPA: putative maltokinase [Bryobacteraceae bacterium]|jgi:maltose alpha-D-glucosyltransferase/alpha-amylase|nr:putative maltokinase [Bryobacteraceae bacterium]